jgi:uncharacterized membrane protein YkvA (DUF1232 family)
MNYLRIFRIFQVLRSQAQYYRDDTARSGELADDALAKAEHHRSALAGVWEDLTAVIRLLKAWAKGHYRAAPWKSISLAIAALLYFVSPIDALPDIIPALGFLDDIFIVTWVMRTIQKDLQKFRVWEKTAA